MESFEDVTDDLLGLPGFIRRNLLLMRELDFRFVSRLNEARKKEQAACNSSGTPLEEKSGHKGTGEGMNDGGASSMNKPAHLEKGTVSSKTQSNKSKAAHDAKGKHQGSDAKRACRSGGSNNVASSAISAATTYELPSTDEMYEIQNIRLEAMYLAQEKLAINDQITCMLKHEYENLKSVFDNMYREMEMNGQMTEKLKQSFTVTKSKTQVPIDSILSQTEMEILEGSSGLPSQEKGGAAYTREGSMTSATNIQTRDGNTRHKDGNLHK